jgi:hypothetical protein
VGLKLDRICSSGGDRINESVREPKAAIVRLSDFTNDEASAGCLAPAAPPF